MLLNERADNEAAQTVMSLINAIGKIGYNPESMNSIYNARAAYDSLTPQQKAIVDANGGLNILKQKETNFNDSVSLYNKQAAELQAAQAAQESQAQAATAALAEGQDRQGVPEQARGVPVLPLLKFPLWQQRFVSAVYFRPDSTILRGCCQNLHPSQR